MRQVGKRRKDPEKRILPFFIEKKESAGVHQLIPGGHDVCLTLKTVDTTAFK